MTTLFLLALLACKDTGDDTGPGAADGGADGGAELSSLTVSATTGWDWTVGVPAEGMVVALDDGAGVRTELTTDASGEVVFEVDWSLGPVDIVVDRGIQQSLTDITEADGDQWIFITDATAERETVITWGNVGPLTEDTVLEVAAFGSTQDYHLPDAATYYLDVVPDDPLTIVAVETNDYYGAGSEIMMDVGNWKVVQADAPAGTTQVDIDLSEPTVPHEVTGSVLLPELGTIRSDAVNVVLYIDSTDSFNALSHGLTTWSVRNTTGFDFTVQYVDLPGKDSRYTKIVVYTLSGQNGAQWRVPGAPDEWTEPPTVLPLPTLQAPAQDWRSSRTLSFEPLDGVDAQRCVQLYDEDLVALMLACSQSGDEVIIPESPAASAADPVMLATQANPFYIVTDGFDLRTSAFQGYAYGPVVSLP